MTISPKWGMWISVAAAILSALMLCAVQFTTLFGAHTSDMIMAVLIIFNACINGVNAVLHMIPSVTPATTAQAASFPLGPTVAHS